MIGLLFTIVVIVLICGAAVWIIGQLVPAHPPMVDRLIWVFCVILVVLVLIQAFGIVDVPVPRVR